MGKLSKLAGEFLMGIAAGEWLEKINKLWGEEKAMTWLRAHQEDSAGLGTCAQTLRNIMGVDDDSAPGVACTTICAFCYLAGVDAGRAENVLRAIVSSEDERKQQ